MDNLPSNVAYTASLSSILTGVLGAFTYEQWNAIGVIIGIGIGVFTALVNLYYKIKDDRRKDRDYAQHHHGKN